MPNGGERSEASVERLSDAAKRLIVALDFGSVEEAREAVAALDGIVSFFKVGYYLQMLRGNEAFIDELLASGKRVFIDYKLGDIPETVKWGVRGAAKRGVDFVTVQGAGDAARAALEAAVEGKVDGQPKILFVTLLTSMGGREAGEAGLSGQVEDIVRDRARLALDVGLDGVIASGREAASIRALAGPERLTIVTPGIRPSGAGSDDHKRATTPGEAIRAGADYLVVGRPILRAADPRAAAAAIITEMGEALEA